jgi:hydroxymethylpyrimidine pyrophosphatase-like HAD family hydrolase
MQLFLRAAIMDGIGPGLMLPTFTDIPKAIAIDLDGTLLDNQTRLTERCYKAMMECLDQKIPIIIATSRPARIFDRLFPKDLAAVCSLAIMNGAIVRGSAPLFGYFKEELSDDVAAAIIDLALEFNPKIRVTLELEGYEFGANWSADSSTLWERNSATPNMVLSLERAIRLHPCKVALGGLGMEVLNLADKIRQHFGDTLSVVPSLLGSPILNITSSLASKPDALKKLLTPIGISLTEVMAFGDDVPDVEMLRVCGISVAVANALPEVKSLCR